MAKSIKYCNTLNQHTTSINVCYVVKPQRRGLELTQKHNSSPRLQSNPAFYHIETNKIMFN